MNERKQEIREKQERITNAILENVPDKFLKTLTRTEYITCFLSVVGTQEHEHSTQIVKQGREENEAEIIGLIL